MKFFCCFWPAQFLIATAALNLMPSTKLTVSLDCCTKSCALEKADRKKTTFFFIAGFATKFCNRRDGVVVGAPASQSVDLGSIP